jgi:hypothetical protein
MAEVRSEAKVDGVVVGDDLGKPSFPQPPRQSELSDEASANTSGVKDGGIDSMFDKLEIADEDFDDFVIEDDTEIVESTRWLAVARVVCTKKFSHEALIQQMQYAWNPAKEVKMRPVGENLFVVQCFCLGDWEKITLRGPWLFREWALVLASYDGFSDPQSVELEFMPIWLQVHKLPEAYRKVHVVEKLVGRVAGEVVVVEMQPAGAFRGDFVRVRVKHDVRKPLTRFVSISHDKKRYLYAVKYEKLGQVCYACGLIGHSYKECRIGVFEEKDLKFGEWIYVTPPGRGRGAGNFRGGLRGGGGEPSYGGGRGGVYDGGHGNRGRGSGTWVDWRQHPEHVTKTSDIDLTDTATSPVKTPDVHMSEAEKSVKKRLAFGSDGQEADNTLATMDVSMLGVEEALHNQGADETEGANDNKRQKKSDGTPSASANSGSAASLEDDRRVQ